MRICENGITRDMTTDEIAKYEEMQKEMNNRPKSQFDLIQEEQERQAQALEELIMMTLGGE